MEEKHMTCIVCPVGCRLTATLDGGRVVKVEGNACPRGAAYARAELTNPVRTLTSTVALAGKRDPGMPALLPVRTDKPIPKGKLLEAMKQIKKLRASLPVEPGDVIAEDFIEPGVKLIACREIK